MGERMTRQLSLIVGMKNDKALQGYKKLRDENGRFVAQSKSGFRSISIGFGKLGGFIQKWAKRALTALLAIPPAILFIGASFSKAMAEVSTLVDTSIVDMRKLRIQVMGLAMEMGKSPKELAKGLYDVISAGVPAGAALNTLRTSAKLAIAGVSETADTFKMLAAVIKGYGDSWDKAGSISDMAFKTVELGQTTIAELATTVGGAIPLANTLGVNFQNVAAVMATLTGVTGNTSEVATQLTSILTGMVKQTDFMQKTIKGLGYETIQAMIAEKGFFGSLMAMKGVVGENVVALGELFGRKEAITSFLALTGAQSEVFVEKFSKIGDASGSVDSAFKKMMLEVSNLWGRFISTLKVGAIAIFDIFATDIANALKKFQSGAMWMVEFIKTNEPQIREGFSRLKNVLSKLWDVAGGVWKVLDAIYVVGATAVNLVTFAFETLKKEIELVTQSVSQMIMKVKNGLGNMGKVIADIGVYMGKAGLIEMGVALQGLAPPEEDLINTRNRVAELTDELKNMPGAIDQVRAAWDKAKESKIAYTMPDVGGAFSTSPEAATPAIPGGLAIPIRPEIEIEPEDYLPLPTDADIEKIKLMQATYETMYSAIEGAGSSYYNTISAMSKAYFTGENKHIKVLDVLGKQMYYGLAAAGLRAVEQIMKARAKEEAAEAISAMAKGLLAVNPFASAAKHAAAALAFGGAAAVAGGAASAVEERAQRDMQRNVGAQSLGAPLGVVGTNTLGYPSSGGGNAYGATVSTAPRTFYINPSFTFQGETIIIGNTGVEDLDASLGEMVERRFDKMMEEGYFEGMNN